jgi:Cys-tRNA(Pro)/Cys-tRNA(Cys) deacylase
MGTRGTPAIDTLRAAGAWFTEHVHRHVAAGSTRGRRPGYREEATGYVAGGISPLVQRRKLPAVIDESAMGWSTVLASGGRRGLDVELEPTDLVALSGARIASIARLR